MSEFWTSQRGTDPIDCGNKFAACVCSRPVHSPTESCECSCGGMWHYDDNGREVVDQLPQRGPDGSPLSDIFPSGLFGGW